MKDYLILITYKTGEVTDHAFDIVRGFENPKAAQEQGEAMFKIAVPEAEIISTSTMTADALVQILHKLESK